MRRVLLSPGRHGLNMRQLHTFRRTLPTRGLASFVLRNFDADARRSLAPLLGLRQATITSAEIREDGRLTVAFADGAVLEVLPDERYEAFYAASTPRV